MTSRYSGGWYIDVLVDLLLETDSIVTRRSALGPALVLRRFDAVTAQRLAELAKGHSQQLTTEEILFVRTHPHAVSIEDGDEVEVRWFPDELSASAFWFEAVRLEAERVSADDESPRHTSGHTLH